jgi:hypothetical protein
MLWVKPMCFEAYFFNILPGLLRWQKKVQSLITIVAISSSAKMAAVRH